MGELHSPSQELTEVDRGLAGTLAKREELGSKELARREADGIQIALLWNKDGNTVSVTVLDERADRYIQIPVGGNLALDAYNHPFAYANGGSANFVPEEQEEIFNPWDKALEELYKLPEADRKFISHLLFKRSESEEVEPLDMIELIDAANEAEPIGLEKAA